MRPLRSVLSHRGNLEISLNFAAVYHRVYRVCGIRRDKMSHATADRLGCVDPEVT